MNDKEENETLVNTVEQNPIPKKYHHHFSNRELGLIYNSRLYANNEPSGMPGHNLAIIINKLAVLLEDNES